MRLQSVFGSVFPTNVVSVLPLEIMQHLFFCPMNLRRPGLGSSSIKPSPADGYDAERILNTSKTYRIDTERRRRRKRRSSKRNRRSRRSRRRRQRTGAHTYSKKLYSRTSTKLICAQHKWEMSSWEIFLCGFCCENHGALIAACFQYWFSTADSTSLK